MSTICFLLFLIVAMSRGGGGEEIWLWIKNNKNTTFDPSIP